MKLKKDQLLRIAPHSVDVIDKFIPYLESYLDIYEINTFDRVAYFIAQVCHESGEFRILKENLNYSAEALLKVFPKYFTKELASKYHRKPTEIANRVYANRMGNGTEQSGEGWKYRGRGLIQITGKNNYVALGYAADPDKLLTPQYAVESACKFWKANNLNRFADKKDFKGLTRAINGGLNGYGERERFVLRAQAFLEL